MINHSVKYLQNDKAELIVNTTRFELVSTLNIENA